MLNRNFLTLGFVMLLAAVLFCGCGGGDKSNPLKTDSSMIIGTWDLTGMTSRFGGNSYNVPNEEILADPLAYTFRPDHSGIMYYQGDVINFSWNTNGDNLTMSSYGYTMVSFTFGVNSKNLHLSFQEQEYYITHIFTKR